MTLSTDDIKARIRAAVDKKGGVAQFAASMDVTPAYIYSVLKSGKAGHRLAKRIGVREIRGQWEEVK